MSNNNFNDIVICFRIKATDVHFKFSKSDDFNKPLNKLIVYQQVIGKLINSV